MQSAILPTYEQFLPKEPARRRPRLTLRYWRSLARRQSVTSHAKNVLLMLFLVLVVVKMWIVPRRMRAAFFVQDQRDLAELSMPQSKEVSAAWGPGVELYDFTAQTVSMVGAGSKMERLLICMPLRNAEPVLDLMLDHLHNLTYPHALIDLAFLVSDSTDDTEDQLRTKISSIQSGAAGWADSDFFNRADVYKHDFGATIGQGVDQRHGVAVQAERRKLMGRARNWLLSAALKPYHSWVYWRDADIESSSPSIIEDLMKHDRDVIVPNVWRPLPRWLGGQQAYDLNSWQESDAALDLASTLHEDDVIVEGYAEYATWRVHLAYLRNEDGSGNQDEIIDLDGVGGVSILAKAKVFRAGVNFPGFAFLSHVETEGFGKMCRTMDFSVAGLVQYTVWHKYEPSDDDLEKMREMTEQGLPID